MSDALKHAQDLEGIFVSEDVTAVKARAIAAALREQADEIARLRALLSESLMWIPGAPRTVGAYANNNLRLRIADALTGDCHE